MLGDFGAICHVVCYNGAVTYDRGRCVASTLMAEDDVRGIVEHVARHHALCACGFERDDQLYALGSFERHGFPREMTVEGTLETLPFGPSPKILVDVSNDAVRASIESILPARCASVVTDQGQLMQISACGVSKKAAIDPICRAAGILWENCLCFGDDANDLALFEVCGRSVAMRNAHRDVILRATDHTSSNAQHGVGRFLQREFPAGVAAAHVR